MSNFDFIDIPLKFKNPSDDESVAQKNGRLNGRTQELPDIPSLPELPEPDVTLEQMLSVCAQGDADSIKRHMAEWVESCAFFNFSQEEDLLEALIPLTTTRVRSRWLSAVRKARKKLDAKFLKIEIEETRQVALHGSSRPGIILSDRQLRDVADEALAHLKSKQQIYLFGDALARVEGGKKVKTLDKPSLPITLSRAANFFRETKSGELLGVSPPTDVTLAVLNHDEKYAIGLMPLLGMVHTPILTPAGVFETQQGYLIGSGYYNASEFNMKVPQPTSTDVQNALVLLDDMLAQFPFASQADKANIIGCIIQPFVRPYIDDICPLYTIDAPVRGTGKTYLAECVAAISTSKDMNSLVQPPKDEAEWQKQITALVMASKPVVIFDNIVGKLSSASLTSLITAPVWAARILGVSEIVEIPLNQTFMITANNIKLSDDLTSRAIWIRLDANMEKPWLRNFARDVKRDIIQNRKKYVEAVATLIAWWQQHGMPQKQNLVTRFKRWEAIVGGILECAGVQCFCDNALSHDSEEVIAWRAFVEWWFDKFNSDHVTASDLMEGASFEVSPMIGKNGHDILGRWITNKTEQGRKVRLGYLLDKHVDKVYGNKKIVFVDINTFGSRVYRLEKI